MLIDGCLNIAVRCESCGKVEFHDITLFQINNKKGYRLHCTCGAEKLFVILQKNKTIKFTIPCEICTINHVYVYGLKELLGESKTTESCPLIGMNLLWIGETEWMEKELLRGESSLVSNGIRTDDFFNSPEIMLDILEWLYQLKTKDVLSCECGSMGKDIGMNLFSDRVELYCKNCTGLSVIYSETEEDLKNLLRTDKIIIREKSFACIDAINFNKNK